MAITFPTSGKSTSKAFAADKPAGDSFADKDYFVQNLKNMDSRAIRYLAQRIAAFLSNSPIRESLTAEDREEIVNDAVFVFLKKIGEGLFLPTEAEPMTYAIAIAKNFVGNRLQKKRLPTAPLDGIEHPPDLDFNPEKFLQDKEREQHLGSLLDQMGDPCRQIIRLRYYDEVPDELAVGQKLVAFSSADSLKTKRSKCLKRLAELVRRNKWMF